MWYRLDCVDEGCPTYLINYFGRPVLGVQVSDMTGELREHFGGDAGVGVLISRVYPRSPAAMAGIETGDLIVAIDGDPVGSTSDIRESLADTEGRIFEVEVIRDRRPVTLQAGIPDFDEN